MGWIFLFLFSSTSFATFLPDNDLWKQDRILGFDQTAMTEQEFNQVIDQVSAALEPSVRLHGGNLQVARQWKDSTVNASSMQFGKSWKVNMYGGLARRPEITKDGFTVVMCHEMGHHLGGYPYSNPFAGWAASEGQADYFATDVCARKVWADEKVENAKSRFEVNPLVKSKCDSAWSNQDDQNLCYRINAASRSLAVLLSGLNKVSEPQFSTPDKLVVKVTNRTYGSAQCRLDTYFNGSLCTVPANLSEIPGRAYMYQNGPKAETDSARSYCTAQNVPSGARPPCWFKSKL